MLRRSPAIKAPMKGRPRSLEEPYSVQPVIGYRKRYLKEMKCGELGARRRSAPWSCRSRGTAIHLGSTRSRIFPHAIPGRQPPVRRMV